MSEVIIDREIAEIVPERYLDYSVEVLKDRAIPDAFDGLKPIYRRVLMAMYDLGLFSNVPYRKCAKTIGEVLGKYHPHGDQSAYEALVGLAQDFNLRYPLIDGSGNFGSVNGEPAAAMRYTEARLSPFGELMLEDVMKLSRTKNNYDNSCQEPVTLSSYWPNLLCNPCSGIAVGLATKFAPHFAKDVYNALIRTIELEAQGKDISLEELIDIIKAPDFPTGAEIINGSEMANIYKTGKGGVVLRAKYNLEKGDIVYYEIPYKVEPKSILEDIEKLRFKGELDDVREVRDESSLLNGMRIVVELKKGANPDFIVNKLFKDTKLQCAYNINMVGVMGNRPKDNLSLKEIVDYYLTDLKKVHLRSKELAREDFLEKLFVVNTILKAIDMIDRVIHIVRTVDNPVETMENELGFTEKEAEYIYNIRISSLSKANKEDLDKKFNEYTGAVLKIEKILADKKMFLQDLAAKLKSIRDGKLLKNDTRHTDILDISRNDYVDIKSCVKLESVVMTYSNFGLIKVFRTDEYSISKRNRVGTKVKLREHEYIVQSFSATTHDDIMLITDSGKVFIVPVYKFGIMNKSSVGRSVNNFINVDESEKIIQVRVLTEADDNNTLILFTRNGMIKRTRISDIRRTRGLVSGSDVITLAGYDKVVAGDIAKGNDSAAVFTTTGRGMIFNIDEEESPVKVTGKHGKGVIGVRLYNNEHVVYSCLIEKGSSVLLISALGFGKCIESSAVRVKKRRQAPVAYMNVKEVGQIVGAAAFTEGAAMLISSLKGQSVIVRTEDFKELGRLAKGRKMISLKDGDSVVSMNKILLPDKEEGGEPENVDYAD